MTGDVRVIHGDCRDALPTLDDIGAIVTDPPYGIAHSSNYGASWQGTEIAGDQDETLRDWVVAFAEDRGIPWAVFGNWKTTRPKGTRGVLVWDKGPAFGMGDLSFPWKMSWELIYLGGPGWRGRRDEGVLRGPPVVSWESKGRLHPHQKPVWLMGAILAKLPSGLAVADPFAGSGSTLIACAKAARPCVGIEIDPACVPVIERRLAEAATPLLDNLTT